MYKLNLNFNKGENILKSLCWIMSYLSWLLLIATGWASIKWLDEMATEYDDTFNYDDYHVGWTIWTFRAYRTVENNFLHYYDILQHDYYPLQMQVSFYYICFILALIITTVGCIIYFVKAIFKKDEQVINGMMGRFSQYHFFPLLCASALFIIGECVDLDFDASQGFYIMDMYEHFKKMYISGLVFSIIGLISLIFIYIMTDLNTNDWWVLLLLKKGTYSCLIVLMWYHFCYSVYYVYYYVNLFGDETDWKKRCGLAFSIIFGIGSLAFSFIFKDLVACVMNLLIYIGLTIGYFKLEEEKRKDEKANNNGDGIVDIIMIALSVVMIALLLLKYRENCLKS